MALASDRGTAKPQAEAVAQKPEKKAVAADLAGQRILVAGATGFLGRYVCAALSSHGAEVVPIAKSGGFDLRNEAEVLQAVLVSHPDMILDVAGPSGGLAHLSSKPAFAFRDTMQIGMNLIHAATSAKIRLITIGNSGSYPEHGPAVLRENAFWGGYPDPLLASCTIARKALLPMMQASKAQHGLRFSYLVPSTVYGPGDHFDGFKASVMGAMIRRFVTAVQDGDDQVICWGKPEIARSFLYAPDFCRAVLAACSLEDDDYPDLINLPGHGETTIGALAEFVAKETGFKGAIAWDEKKPTGAPRRILDGRLAKRILGWEPQMTLETGVRATIRWYEENKPKE